jgi:hypothetical protein
MWICVLIGKFSSLNCPTKPAWISQWEMEVTLTLTLYGQCGHLPLCHRGNTVYRIAERSLEWTVIETKKES